MRALEFYSGIGGKEPVTNALLDILIRVAITTFCNACAWPEIAGMHYGLQLACPEAEVAEAFDIDDVANDVYESNFGHRPYQAREDCRHQWHARGNF